MGGGDYVEHQNLVSLVPEIALCAIDRIEKLKDVTLKEEKTTPQNHALLEEAYVWIKVPCQYRLPHQK